jgi:uncharacterized membrane protein
MRWLRGIGVVLLIAGYPLLVHYTNTAGVAREFNQLGAVVSVAPLAALAAWAAWGSRHRAVLLAALVLCACLLWWCWPLLTVHYGFVYWLQHMAMQLILLFVFGRTLRPGQEPLCTRFARVVHAPHELSARHERYTRQVTLAWAVFFVVMALVSTVLFFAAPLAAWSVFANFLTLPLVALVFVVEYRVRGWYLPNVPPVPIWDGVRAFMNNAGARRA